MKRLFRSLAPLLVFAAAGAAPYHGAFTEVPPTAVHPQGWLQEMLRRQTEGLAKHHAASGYPYDTCLWAGKIAKGGSSPYWKPWWPYEQTGYLVDGLERLGLLTNDPALLAEANASIQYILAHPAPDGSLGPTHIGPNNWPHAVVFRALMAADAAHPDPTIPEAMRRHYLARPADFGAGRDVCNVEAMLWAYSRTGDTHLLDVARRTYDNFNRSKPRTSLAALAGDDTVVEHGVTFNETAKLPALLYLYTGDRSLLDASVNAYRKIDRDHMLPSGLHTAEEKLDGSDPWRYTETCDVSDYTWSVGYLLMATGDATWADHIEKAIFNAGLGAITKDFKAHQYFSSPNQVVAAPGVCKRYAPDRLAYQPGHDVECCSGNVHRFLPNFALRQWMRTPDGGVVAALYAPTRLETTVDGKPVTIDEQTDYPFSETISFVIHTPAPAAFPLLLRIPGWTEHATVAINGGPAADAGTPGTFHAVRRTFIDGDRITLQLPMSVRVRQSGHAASVERGPLVFSLKVEESSTPVVAKVDGAGAKTFPAWDKRPASDWNYALAPQQGRPLAEQVQVVRRTNADGFPWDVGNAPVELRAPARQVLNWTLAADGGNPGFPAAPRCAPDTITVTLVPYGATCLRLTAFPLTAATVANAAP